MLIMLMLILFLMTLFNSFINCNFPCETRFDEILLNCYLKEKQKELSLVVLQNSCSDKWEISQENMCRSLASFQKSFIVTNLLLSLSINAAQQRVNILLKLVEILDIYVTWVIVLRLQTKLPTYDKRISSAVISSMMKKEIVSLFPLVNASYKIVLFSKNALF